MTSLTEMPWMLLFAVPWQQISGAVAGGLVGGFSGFVANTVHARRETRRSIDQGSAQIVVVRRLPDAPHRLVQLLGRFPAAALPRLCKQPLHLRG